MKRYAAVLCAAAVIALSGLTACKGFVSTDSVTEELPTVSSTAPHVTTTTEKTATPSQKTKPAAPESMALADLPYWEKADAFRISHTTSPPFKAATLHKGTKEYETLYALLQRTEGAYLHKTHEGLYGGFIPIFVCQGDKRLDRIAVSVKDDGQFSTDTQREASENKQVTGKYASLYAMPQDVAEEIRTFLKSLEYTEEL